jgi:hypothetical protein
MSQIESDRVSEDARGYQLIVICFKLGRCYPLTSSLWEPVYRSNTRMDVINMLKHFGVI